MKKILTSSFIILALALVACGGKDDKKAGDGKEGVKEVPKVEEAKETAASIAQQWCELNGKAHRAAEGAEKKAAETALMNFEEAMEKKYDADKAFMDEIGKEAEKCEDASEGK